jgi:phosphatidylglycerol:prolipoprotein diacylglycerol transferase
MFPVIRFGSLTLQARGLILLVTFWVASDVAGRAAKRLGLRDDDVANLAFLGLMFGLIGARLGYVIQYWSIYRTDLGAIFALNFNTLSPVAGIIVGCVAAIGYARRKGIANRRLLDALTPGLIIFAAGLALADLASGDGYGAPALLPWSINLWGEPRHPTQLYDFLAVIGIGFIVWRASRPFDGARFGLFVVLYAAVRLLLETFHGDSATIADIRVVQIWSLLALVLALWLLHRWAREWAQNSEVPHGST